MNSSPSGSRSPYKEVRSKVAANMASRKQAKKNQAITQSRKQYDEEILASITTSSPPKGTHYIAGNSILDHSSSYIVGMPQRPSPTRESMKRSPVKSESLVELETQIEARRREIESRQREIEELQRKLEADK